MECRFSRVRLRGRLLRGCKVRRCRLAAWVQQTGGAAQHSGSVHDSVWGVSGCGGSGLGPCPNQAHPTPTPRLHQSPAVRRTCRLGIRATQGLLQVSKIAHSAHPQEVPPAQARQRQGGCSSTGGAEAGLLAAAATSAAAASRLLLVDSCVVAGLHAVHLGRRKMGTVLARACKMAQSCSRGSSSGVDA